MERELPQKVTITVISGRQLQGRRKGEPIRASVVFGLGKELFQTEEVESTEPFWNQEAHVNVSGKLTDSLKFKLKDQGHTIGIISVPISSLTRRKHDQWIPFQPYKKDRSYHGDLCLSCYVSEVRIASDLSPTNSHSSSEDVSGSGKKSGGIGAHFEKWSPLGGKLGIGNNRLSSSSDSDIRKDLSGGGHLSPIDDERMSSPLGNDDDSQLPDVSGISPSEGSTHGNERIVLRGTNLGESRSDIVKVLLVDVDCTKTVEYFSSGKLVITSLPRDMPTTGPVVVETMSGGTGVSSVHFTYTKKDQPRPDVLHLGGTPSSGQRKSRLSDQEIADLQAENKSLKLQVKELKESKIEMSEELTSLRGYLERLLSTIMNNNPELLELAKE
ncbi:PREDICTED: uncharacterized protein LOC105313866 isoform X1 [Amphimedon queenslandica]|uniref:FIP-RBD domain-containing protein n=1 Tax=Amphimedon queenslandica TaxID=400682 RepID=A0AAN0IPN0_AMPQE|nr:PREDICTED: uncharacterized protein LOC105313866 isoform X1 [Amphimedon queenslandica]|eukprot:XP_011405932.2 PREDICTED: uncharacterized protein LOC105313866 isoform X1 [Amphimedon queenslandica]